MFRLFNNVKKSQINRKEVAQLTAVALIFCAVSLAYNLIGNREVFADTEHGLRASYYSQVNFTGKQINRSEPQINFDWNYGSPFSDDNPFSARWEGQIQPRYTEQYTFTTLSDDGVRLWIDGNLVINNWTDHARVEDTGIIKLNANQKYDIKLEFYENTGRAILNLYWQSASQNRELIPQSHLFTTSSNHQVSPSITNSVTTFGQTQGLNGQYFAGRDFDNPAVSRVDSTVDFDWHTLAPDTSMPDNSFSVRWTGQIQPDYSEKYSFTTLSDDGVRLWIDGKLIIDSWNDHPQREDSGTVKLTANQKYNIKLEFYENSGLATIKLYWSSRSQAKQIIPPSKFTPTLHVTAPDPLITPTPAPTVIDRSEQTPNTDNPIGKAILYVNPYSQAQIWVNQQWSTNPSQASQGEIISKQSQAIWLGGWNSNVQNDVSNHMNNANGTVPVFVAYNVPDRDCGSHSAGGVSSAESYNNWIANIATGIGNRQAIIILEPDALSLTTCLDDAKKQQRNQMLKSAITSLKSNGKTAVYLDAGHPNWINAEDMAQRLTNAGLAQADGFALNTSNFVDTPQNISYGQKISTLTNGKHFVIDTSRNGNGSNGEWCNPDGRKLGQLPTNNTGHNLIDAFLWVKSPGESDGQCNGGPSAGTWWPEYALNLIK